VETGIAQAVTKRIKRITFKIHVGAPLANIVVVERRKLFHGTIPGAGQFSAGVVIAEQDLGQRGALGLSRANGTKDGRQIFLFPFDGHGVVGREQLTGSIVGYVKNAKVYRDPGDNTTYDGQLRVRSCSENGYVGITIYEQKAHPNEINPDYRVFRKDSDFAGLSPSDCFTFLNENPQSLNDGFFRVEEPYTSGMPDRPAFHYGDTAFAYADGHAALHAWHNCFLSYTSTDYSGSDNQ
jgi:hypothetical protein